MSLVYPIMSSPTTLKETRDDEANKTSPKEKRNREEKRNSGRIFDQNPFFVLWKTKRLLFVFLSVLTDI